MHRIVRHFASRLRREHITSTSATSNAGRSRTAWDRFDEWLDTPPHADARSQRERELAHEHARTARVLISQAGTLLVRRIALAREEARLANEVGARFALELALTLGNADVRAAAQAEVGSFE